MAAAAALAALQRLLELAADEAAAAPAQPVILNLSAGHPIYLCIILHDIK